MPPNARQIPFSTFFSHTRNTEMPIAIVQSKSNSALPEMASCCRLKIYIEYVLLHY